MKSLEQIKEEYAVSYGENNWNDFKSNWSKQDIEEAMDKIVLIYCNEKIQYIVDSLDFGDGCYADGAYCSNKDYDKILLFKDKI